MSVLARIRRSISTTPAIQEEPPTPVPEHRKKSSRAFDTLSPVSGSHQLSEEHKAILRGIKEGKSLEQCRAEYEELKARERLDGG